MSPRNYLIDHIEFDYLILGWIWRGEAGQMWRLHNCNLLVRQLELED